MFWLLGSSSDLDLMDSDISDSDMEPTEIDPLLEEEVEEDGSTIITAGQTPPCCVCSQTYLCPFVVHRGSAAPLKHPACLHH